MSSEILSIIISSIVEGRPDETVDLTQQALADGLEPLIIIDDGLTAGMNIVGDKFQIGEYYLPHLIIAASGMKRAMALLEPELKARQQEATACG